jgi:hypothetical protein
MSPLVDSSMIAFALDEKSQSSTNVPESSKTHFVYS